MSTLTLRSIFEESAVLSLWAEAEFADNYALQASRDLKPKSDHFLPNLRVRGRAVDDGSMALCIVSTTVLGIQRYTTTRLRHQGVQVLKPDADCLTMETIRAHYRAQQDVTLERCMSLGSALPLSGCKHFPNGAGDLTSPPEITIADPHLAELERLFSLPAPRLDTEGDEEEL